uniref:Uncharacterized protein n=1 Tax=Glossina pallidipes TaxID=7398 RepID=A0A1B0A7G9_GLOPL
MSFLAASWNYMNRSDVNIKTTLNNSTLFWPGGGDDGNADDDDDYDYKVLLSVVKASNVVFVQVGVRVRVAYGPVAQWITRLTTDQKIPGSTPGRIAEIKSLVFKRKHRKCSGLRCEALKKYVFVSETKMLKSARKFMIT